MSRSKCRKGLERRMAGPKLAYFEFAQFVLACDVLRMPRRPIVTLPGTVRLPEVEIPRPRPAPAPSPRTPATPTSSLKVTTRRAISRIKKRLRSADAEYYAVGKELASLDRPAVLSAFGGEGDAVHHSSFSVRFGAALLEAAKRRAKGTRFIIHYSPFVSGAASRMMNDEPRPHSRPLRE